jgi:hypothetical protein
MKTLAKITAIILMVTGGLVILVAIIGGIAGAVVGGMHMAGVARGFGGAPFGGGRMFGGGMALLLGFGGMLYGLIIAAFGEGLYLLSKIAGQVLPEKVKAAVVTDVTPVDPPAAPAKK